MIVKERGIPMSTPMVLATMRDDKTQTRRVMNPQPTGPGVLETTPAGEVWYLYPHPNGNDVGYTKFPYGKVGDHLYVREELRGDGKPGNKREGIVRYGADGEMVLPCVTCGFVRCQCQGGTDCVADVLWHWQRIVLSARYCPRWASRTLLEITNIRAEPVQRIHNWEIKAEGLPPYTVVGSGTLKIPQWITAQYRDLWDSINAKRDGGKYSWASNPWVWVIDYKRIQS